MSSTDSDPDPADGHQDDDLEPEHESDQHESPGGDDLFDDDRPGRFYGPDSSWRFYTQRERALAATLDQAEHNDLSIHLYNAHAWKQQHRDEERITRAKSWQSKQQWIKTDEKGKLPFLPPAAWTAWPLRLEEVPRSTEQWGIPVTTADDDDATIRAPKSWKPSLHLQEEVEAIFLRLAKERFRAREWADERIDEAVKAEKTSRSRGPSFVKAEHDSDEPLDDLNRLEQQLPQESSPCPGESAEHYVPMLLDDDDAASRIIRPSARHLLSKFDHLLIALHKSRQGHRKERGGSRSRSRGSRSRSKSHVRPRSSDGGVRKRKRVASDANRQDEDYEVESLQDYTDAGEDAHNRNPSKSTLGTRDWSEVVGLAALVGFDQTVIDRTARRCAALFRESMTLRTMPEVLAGTAYDQTTEYTPDMVPPIASESDGGSSDKSSDEDSEIYACPHTTCARHDRPYEQRWRLNEHLKRKHKYTDEQLITVAVKQALLSQESSADASDSDQESSGSVQGDLGEPGQVDFLQPITMHIGRSKDRRARQARSRSSGARRAASRNDEQSSGSA